MLGVVWRDYRQALLLGWIGLLVLVIGMVPWDRELLDALRLADSPWADQFGRWSGDFSKPHWVPLLSTILLFGLGIWKKRRLWREAAVVALISCLVAGMTVNLFRGGLGRPRPTTEAADGFFGPTTEHAYQSFPSGHSGASFGYAAALATAMPHLAVPATIFAVQTGWARMQIRRHRLSDVVAGAGIGITWGWLLGLSVRRLNGVGRSPGLPPRRFPRKKWSRLPAKRSMAG